MVDAARRRSRELGVEFGVLSEKLESHEYRATKAELVSEYGERTLTLPGGETTFEEALSPYDSDQPFASADEVRRAVVTTVGADAVGRRRYSDRGIGNRLDEDDESV
jgi:hypothetical protein